MVSKIASTSFQTGPDDSVAVPDVYSEIVSTTPLNSVVKTADVIKDKAGNILSDVSKEAIALAKDSISYATDPKELTKIVVDGIATGKLDFSKLTDIPTSKEEALELLKGIAGDNIGELNKLKDLKGPLLNNLIESTGFSGAPLAIIKGKLGLPGGATPVDALLDENPKFKMLFNSAAKIKANGDPNSAKGVTAMLGAVLGDSTIGSVLQLDKEFSALQKILDKAVVLGIPGAIDRTLAKFDAIEEKKQLSTKLLSSISNTGTLSDINSLLDHADINAVVAKNPNLISDILANFRLPDGTQFPTVSLKNELVDTLVRINPLWDKVSGFSYAQLDVFRTISDDGYKTLLLDSDLAIAVTLSREYGSVSFDFLVRRDFPKLAI